MTTQSGPSIPAPPDGAGREELRDALIQIGVSLVLENQKPSEEEPEPPPPAEEPKGPRKAPVLSRPVRWLIGATAVGGLAFGLVSAMSGGTGSIPPDLVGRWESLSPRYAGRELRIAPQSVTFQTSPKARLEAYPVKAVRRTRAGTTWRFQIDYDTPAGPYTLDVQIAGTDRIRFSNQAGVEWVRRKGSAT